MPQIGIGSLVLRQTPESKYSYFEGSLEQVATLAEENFSKAVQGYRDGVVLVPVPPQGFFSGVVEVSAETMLRASFAARRREEDPYIQNEAVGAKKLPAKKVELVLYRHDILTENNEASTDADWELISINARPTEDLEPLSPMAMARNFLSLPGGTKADYTAEQFARAIIFWSTRAMAAGE